MRVIIFIISVLLFLTANPLRAQKKETDIREGLRKLITYKYNYEEFRELAKKEEQYSEKRDSAYTLYLRKIKAIKDAPEIYLTHINEALANGTADLPGEFPVPYDYFNPASSSPRLHVVRISELYKIIKESLFERGDKRLPEKTEAYKNSAGGTGYNVIHPKP